MAIDSNRIPTYVVRKHHLTKLDKISLVDLLEHKTKLLLAARKLDLPERGYIEQLRLEIKLIQEEIKSRPA